MSKDEMIERLLKLGVFMIDNKFPKDEMDAVINSMKMVQITNALFESRLKKGTESGDE